MRAAKFGWNFENFTFYIVAIWVAKRFTTHLIAHTLRSNWHKIEFFSGMYKGCNSDVRKCILFLYAPCSWWHRIWKSHFITACGKKISFFVHSISQTQCGFFSLQSDRTFARWLRSTLFFATSLQIIIVRRILWIVIYLHRCHWRLFWNWKNGKRIKA